MRRAIVLALLCAPLLAQAAVPRDALKYRNDLIRNARAVWGLAAPVATFAGQVHQESAWRADARSHVGAVGLAQFMPSTSQWISGLYRGELGANEPLNPAWALRALVRYDLWLYERVRVAHSPCDRFLFALSAYNGGLGWVNRRQARSPDPGDYGVTSEINPGIHPANQRENAEYPVRIVFRWQSLYLTWGPGVCA
jgi:soluble lytic murein transglycosylase-like protein